MIRRIGSFVGAFLPLLPLAFCTSAGGDSPDPDAQGEATSLSASAPASANRAPLLLARVDDSVQVGERYEWQPVASDPDGDELTFSAVNLPPWASLDTHTGRISGTPTKNDIGIHESITISVADNARHTTTSQPFSITVAGDVGNGVASLRWELPQSKVDGSPLDDLAGFRILYGRSSEDLDHSVFIGDASATSHEIGSLGSGLWYFAVVAVSANGLEGPPTTIASKSI